MDCQSEKSQYEKAARAAQVAVFTQVTMYHEFTRALQKVRAEIEPTEFANLFSMNPAEIAVALEDTEIPELRPVYDAASAVVNAEKTAAETGKKSLRALQRYQESLNNAQLSADELST